MSRPLFYIFRHYATYRKLRKKISKKIRKFFFSIFSFLRAFVVSSCRKSGFRVFLSLRYGADLGRSRRVLLYHYIACMLYTRVDPLTSVLDVMARSCQILTTSWQPCMDPILTEILPRCIIISRSNRLRLKNSKLSKFRSRVLKIATFV